MKSRSDAAEKAVRVEGCYCGCCGRDLPTGDWCRDCARHIAQNGAPWERTYYAQFKAECPYAPGSVSGCPSCKRGINEAHGIERIGGSFNGVRVRGRHHCEDTFHLRRPEPKRRTGR